MIVMKFGGSSVESQKAVAAVTSIVQSYQHRSPIVVVSAMGKTTNKLISAATEAAAGRREQALLLVDELRAYHLTHGLPLAGGASAELDRYIRTHFEWLEELVKGLSVVGEPASASAFRVSWSVLLFARPACIPSTWIRAASS
jgi:aspartokinase